LDYLSFVNIQPPIVSLATDSSIVSPIKCSTGLSAPAPASDRWRRAGGRWGGGPQGANALTGEPNATARPQRSKKFPRLRRAGEGREKEEEEKEEEERERRGGERREEEGREGGDRRARAARNSHVTVGSLDRWVTQPARWIVGLARSAGSPPAHPFRPRRPVGFRTDGSQDDINSRRCSAQGAVRGRRERRDSDGMTETRPVINRFAGSMLDCRPQSHRGRARALRARLLPRLNRVHRVRRWVGSVRIAHPAAGSRTSHRSIPSR